MTDKQHQKILIAGDSISEGVIYDSRKGEYIILKSNFANILKENIKGTIDNISTFGSTIIKGIRKIQRYLLKNKPDIAIIEFGGNDCDYDWEEVVKNPFTEHKPKTELHIFKEKLRELVDLLSLKKTETILMTLPPVNSENYFRWISKNKKEIGKKILQWLGSVDKIFSWQEKYSQTIEDISEELKIGLIDIRASFFGYPDFKALLCADGIHPNEAGHKIIARTILSYLKENYSTLIIK